MHIIFYIFKRLLKNHKYDNGRGMWSSLVSKATRRSCWLIWTFKNMFKLMCYQLYTCLHENTRWVVLCGMSNCQHKCLFNAPVQLGTHLTQFQLPETHFNINTCNNLCFPVSHVQQFTNYNFIKINTKKFKLWNVHKSPP